tara:strand:- start:1811 stop:2113 length:303 start_codon:yes stop_codon:yes gene_type:complete
VATYKRAFAGAVTYVPASQFDRWVREEILSGEITHDEAFFLDGKLIYTLIREPEEITDPEEFDNCVGKLFLSPIDDEGKLDTELYLLHKNGSVTIPSWMV